jgi:hypothetical protein
MNFVLVFLGGGIGCVIRYCIGLFFQKTSLQCESFGQDLHILCNTVFAKVAHKKSNGQLLLQNLFLCNTTLSYHLAN